eukprot:405540-Hanusia_phi.AAC.8
MRRSVKKACPPTAVTAVLPSRGLGPCQPQADTLTSVCDADGVEAENVADEGGGGEATGPDEELESLGEGEDHKSARVLPAPVDLEEEAMWGEEGEPGAGDVGEGAGWAEEVDEERAGLVVEVQQDDPDSLGAAGSEEGACREPAEVQRCVGAQVDLVQLVVRADEKREALVGASEEDGRRQRRGDVEVDGHQAPALLQEGEAQQSQRIVVQSSSSSSSTSFSHIRQVHEREEVLVGAGQVRACQAARAAVLPCKPSPAHRLQVQLVQGVLFLLGPSISSSHHPHAAMANQRCMLDERRRKSPGGVPFLHAEIRDVQQVQLGALNGLSSSSSSSQQQHVFAPSSYREASAMQQGASEGVVQPSVPVRAQSGRERSRQAEEAGEGEVQLEVAAAGDDELGKAHGSPGGAVHLELERSAGEGQRLQEAILHLHLGREALVDHHVTPAPLQLGTAQQAEERAVGGGGGLVGEVGEAQLGEGWGLREAYGGGQLVVAGEHSSEAAEGAGWSFQGGEAVRCDVQLAAQLEEKLTGVEAGGLEVGAEGEGSRGARGGNDLQAPAGVRGEERVGELDGDGLAGHREGEVRCDHGPALVDDAGDVGDDGSSPAIVQQDAGRPGGADLGKLVAVPELGGDEVGVVLQEDVVGVEEGARNLVCLPPHRQRVHLEVLQHVVALPAAARQQEAVVGGAEVKEGDSGGVRAGQLVREGEAAWVGEVVTQDSDHAQLPIELRGGREEAALGRLVGQELGEGDRQVDEADRSDSVRADVL